MDYTAFFEANRLLWNDKTDPHIQSDFYGMAAFKKGANTLNAIEMEQLGNVAGQKLLHLQCHFGQDTLSLARMGAAVTGIDLSDKAIQRARELGEELGLPTRFLCCNLYDLSSHLNGETFDQVFTSYGALPWLPDLIPWGQLIARHLRPGGTFHLVEFHPVVWMFDNDFRSVAYSYFNRETIEESVEGTYADRNAPISGTAYSWNHGLGEVFEALERAGLQVNRFREYDYSPYPCFPEVVSNAKGPGYQIPGLAGKIPMVYALRAVKSPS
ncbi:MAG: class I SAM-dependent methyltransferase [Chloroflexia bacterium]|nr:class I SAM-dependent methyltransferase [Chloroflexia bacterium]